MQDKKPYTPPQLEPQPNYVAITGVSLPFGTQAEDGGLE
jgi:hypothetical protein